MRTVPKKTSEVKQFKEMSREASCKRGVIGQKKLNGILYPHLGKSWDTFAF